MRMSSIASCGAEEVEVSGEMKAGAVTIRNMSVRGEVTRRGCKVWKKAKPARKLDWVTFRRGGENAMWEKQAFKVCVTASELYVKLFV